MISYNNLIEPNWSEDLNYKFPNITDKLPKITNYLFSNHLYTLETGNLKVLKNKIIGIGASVMSWSNINWPHFKNDLDKGLVLGSGLVLGDAVGSVIGEAIYSNPELKVTKIINLLPKVLVSSAVGMSIAENLESDPLKDFLMTATLMCLFTLGSYKFKAYNQANELERTRQENAEPVQ